MNPSDWPTEPLIIIKAGTRKGKEISAGSLAVRDPDDGWYWVSGRGWLHSENSTIDNYTVVIPVSFDNNVSMTWYTEYAPKGFMTQVPMREEAGAPAQDSPVWFYRKAIDFMENYRGPFIPDEVSTLEVIADLDLDCDIDLLKLAASAYDSDEMNVTEMAERAHSMDPPSKTQILFLAGRAYRADISSGLVEELAASALSRWGSLQ